MPNVQTEALSTSAENVTFTGNGTKIYLENLDGTATIWVRADGTTVVAAADGAYPLAPNQSKVLRLTPANRATIVVSAIASSGTPSLFGYILHDAADGLIV